MDQKFWIECWEKNLTGFDQSAPHPFLVNHFNKLNLHKGSLILAPLCGKSIDMIWLKDQGYKVLGIELSQKAIKAFFETHKISYKKEGAFYISKDISIFCGDFFSFNFSYFNIFAIYDRASLIALPELMRRDYYAKIKELTDKKTPWFLIKISYQTTQIVGPPFSIKDEEILAQFPAMKIDQKTKKMKKGQLRAAGAKSASSTLYIV